MNPKNPYAPILAILMTAGLSSCSLFSSQLPIETPPPDPPTPISNILDEIIVNQTNLFPEGIEYDQAGKRFLLGSMAEGRVYQVFDDGSVAPFIEDPDLVSSVGIEIDRINDRLLVTNNDPVEKKSYLGAYDLSTGERLFMVEFSNIKPGVGHFANDVAVDKYGNAYITDYLTPSIYLVDMEGSVSLFLEHELFDQLNGIVYHPDGYLLLGSCCGKLLKIQIGDPEVVQVDIPAGYLGFNITDGMVLHPDGSLVMVTFPDNKIGRLQSGDNWNSAQHVSMSTGHAAGYGTTITLRGDDVYMIYSYLNRRNDDRDQTHFEIVLVEFH